MCFVVSAIIYKLSFMYNLVIIVHTAVLHISTSRICVHNYSLLTREYYYVRLHLKFFSSCSNHNYNPSEGSNTFSCTGHFLYEQLIH